MKIPHKPPDLDKILDGLTSEGRNWRIDLQPDGPNDAEVEGRYLHWEEVRHRPPPAGLSAEEWWYFIARARRAIQRPLPLLDLADKPFMVAAPDSVQKSIYTIDRDASGRIELPDLVLNEPTRDRYIVSSLIEEAITSSQLEGASTTRQVAKEMIRDGREPTTPDERMIFNNFRAMEWIRERRDAAITPPLVLELHRIVTDETLTPDAAGRYRRHDEPVRVYQDDEVVHIPPPAPSLPERMATMCRFATGALDAGFIHPVVRSILLHFWLGFDHPFVDGNGRTARALFYWSMLQQGYWLAEFLSISSLIRKAPVQYGRAYLFAETTSDATYFVVHQLGVIRRAIDALVEDVKRKSRELHETESLLRTSHGLNHRQLALLTHALRHADAHYTIEAHRKSHNVVYQTARQDLLDLAKRRWLQQRKVGRSFVFVPVPDLEHKVSPRRRR